MQASRTLGKDAALDDYALYTSGYDEGSESYLNPQTGACAAIIWCQQQLADADPHTEDVCNYLAAS